MDHEKILFDRGWLFHRGDIETPAPTCKGTAYTSAKTERVKMGPACKDYRIPSAYAVNEEHRTEQWEKIDLPHDYLINDVPDRKYNEAFGFVDGGNAWYLKRFSVSKADLDKRITLLFEGIAGHATVYLNGCLLKRNFCGYTTFEVDLTDYLDFEKENALAVYAESGHHEGWWYEGAGIYRHVWMIKTERIAFDLWGIYAKPERQDGDRWVVKTELTVRNDHDTPRRVSAVCSLTDATGATVVEAACRGGAVPPRAKRTFTVEIPVKDPLLWSPDAPNLHTLTATLFAGAHVVDGEAVRIGFRTFVMDPNKGLFINGKHYKIKGYCAHETCGFGGRWVADNIQRHRVKLMKENGANGYRCSHYPQAESLMDALDENGFIVMAETRWFESTEDSLAQLEMLIKRDRNHPSVFFWSLGNEEPFHLTEQGRRIFKTMKAYARRLDDRPMITAITHSPENATVLSDCDLIGINYKWDHYDAVRQKCPEKPILSSECGATGTTRGRYHGPDPIRGVLSAYDTTINNAFRSRERTWQYIMEHDWIMGGYHWDFNEHRGEGVWPRICSLSGSVDLFWRKKDAYYQHTALWTTKPMIHLLPHWNHEGLEGALIRVVAYTNQSAAELFLNGNSLDRISLSPWGHAEWQVPYEKGELCVKAYDKDGHVTATDTRVTAGAATRLALTLETKELCANGCDLALIGVTVQDAAGNVVSTADPTVSFTVEGVGKLWGTGGANTDHVPVCSPDRKLWMGEGAVAVRASDQAGTCRVIAEAAGLLSAVLTFEFK